MHWQSYIQYGKKNRCAYLQKLKDITNKKIVDARLTRILRYFKVRMVDTKNEQ